MTLLRHQASCSRSWAPGAARNWVQNVLCWPSALLKCPFFSRHMFFLSGNEITSFKLSWFSLKTEHRILINLCSIRVLLPKSLRSSSYVVCLCQKTKRTALSFTFSIFSGELLLQKCQVCTQKKKYGTSKGSTFLMRLIKTATCRDTFLQI